MNAPDIDDTSATERYEPLYFLGQRIQGGASEPVSGVMRCWPDSSRSTLVERPARLADTQHEEMGWAAFAGLVMAGALVLLALVDIATALVRP